MTPDSNARSSRTRTIARTALAMIAVAAFPLAAGAQRARPHVTRSCAPRGASRGPAFVFGNEGGNLKRSATKLWADGSVQAGPGRRSAADAGIADSVSALARFARESSFWTTTSPRITRPTRNPDMARVYLEAHLTCGTRRSLYPADAEPAAFHELIARLTAIAALAPAR